jgi:hypothetical protein
LKKEETPTTGMLCINSYCNLLQTPEHEKFGIEILSFSIYIFSFITSTSRGLCGWQYKMVEIPSM